jgi:hypothetical protein
MTRKDFLRLAALSAGAWLTGRLPAASAAGDAAAERVGLLIQEFDRQGNHRTGTRPDVVSGQWLATAMQGWTVGATLEPFALNRVDPVAASVQFRERRIDGVPLFDGGFTDAAGVTGRFGVPGRGVDIALVDAGDPAWRDVRRGSAVAGVVLVTRGGRPGLALEDAPDFATPSGPPVLQVSSDDGVFLREQAERAPDARLTLDVRRTSVRALNVVARIKGRDAALAPVVISAPRSAWWRAAGERGGGLACLAELSRALSSARLVRDCVLVSLTGSELGLIGFSAFAAARRDLVEGARAWVCLGPNLGASGGTGLWVHHSSPDLGTAAAGALADAGVTVEGNRGGEPAGEAARIEAAGGAWLWLCGRGNPYERLAADRWPDAVSVDAVARISSAVAAVVLRLAAQ